MNWITLFLFGYTRKSREFPNVLEKLKIEWIDGGRRSESFREHYNLIPNGFTKRTSFQLHVTPRIRESIKHTNKQHNTNEHVNLAIKMLEPIQLVHLIFGGGIRMKNETLFTSR